MPCVTYVRRVGHHWFRITSWTLIS